MTKYTQEMLEIAKAPQWLERNRERFFRNGRATGAEIAYHVTYDIVWLGGQSRIRRLSPWWIITSDLDWFAPAKEPLKDLFARIVPAPHLGINSMRSDVVVSTFSSSVAAWNDGRWCQIKGQHVPDEIVDSVERERNIGTQAGLVFLPAEGPSL